MKSAWQTKAELYKVLDKHGYTLTTSERMLISAYDAYEGADFWNKWVYPEGATPEQIQNELSDFRSLMSEVSEVYMHITQGRISKQNTKAFAVIGEADAVNQRDTAEAIEEATEELQDEIIALEKALLIIADHPIGIGTLPSQQAFDNIILTARVALGE